MGKREVGTLKGGMILGENLYTPEGKCILRKGEALGDRHIRMLKIWGIPEAEILEEDLPEELLTEQDPGYSPFSDRAFRLVGAWFPPNSEEDLLMKELRRLCALRVARAMREGTLPEGLFPRVQVAPPQMPDSEELDFSAHSLVRNEAQLASYPDIYFRIKEVLDSPVSSARHIAEVVSTDPNLSMRLLRLVNSSFYGFPYPIESIPRAVTIIGSRELTNLALAVSTMSIFQGVPEEYVEMRSFWEHSLACGVIARILANLRRFPEEERFFLAGLFHDAGKLVLYRKKTPGHDGTSCLLSAPEASHVRGGRPDSGVQPRLRGRASSQGMEYPPYPAAFGAGASLSGCPGLLSRGGGGACGGCFGGSHALGDQRLLLCALSGSRGL